MDAPMPGFRRRRNMMPEAPRSNVGFVVIGRNEGERLVRCLRSLAHVRGTIVYVDSNSIDGSVAAATRAGAHVVPLDASRPFTAARARNEGAARLRHVDPGVAFIQFLDGDCEFAAGWLPAAFAFMEKRPAVAVTCGRRRERDPGRSVFNRLCDLEWNTPVGQADACGGDALMRADAFHAVSGFNARLTAGEEPELCARLRNAGWEIWRLPEEMTLHDANITRLRQWWRRNVRGGYGYAQVWATTRTTPAPLYGRELKRAGFWGGLVPLAAAVALPLFWPVAAVLLLLPPAQVVRIALRRGVRMRASWAYAFFTMLAKLPEFQGSLKYLGSAGQSGSAIRYK